MSDPEIPSQPLLGETVVNVGPPAQGQRSTRAYTVAGLTLLACVLIMGQAAIAYFLVNQKKDKFSLSHMLLVFSSAASVPVRLHIPMSHAMEMMDTTMEVKDDFTTPTTQCQLEAAGVKPGPMPGFFPRCDKLGLYEPQQCFQGQCWCVSPADGQPIPGDKSCIRSAFSGEMVWPSDFVK
uniref:Thyroglobulin type-1 domain-containing protein n=1 Tax=Xiphophorus couchianus TaxID=32473 RepID=A0A3B5M8Z1_9TELE